MAFDAGAAAVRRISDLRLRSPPAPSTIAAMPAATSAIGDDRAIERDDAVPLGDPRERGDLEQQRLGREPAARRASRSARECTAEIGSGRAQDQAASTCRRRRWRKRRGRGVAKHRMGSCMQGVCRIVAGRNAVACRPAGFRSPTDPSPQRKLGVRAVLFPSAPHKPVEIPAFAGVTDMRRGLNLAAYRFPALRRRSASSPSGKALAGDRQHPAARLAASPANHVATSVLRKLARPLLMVGCAIGA